MALESRSISSVSRSPAKVRTSARTRARSGSLVRPLVDLVALASATAVTLLWPGDRAGVDEVAVIILFVPLTMVQMCARGLYRPKIVPITLRGVMPVVGAVSTTAMALFVVAAFTGNTIGEHGDYVRLWGAGLIAVGTGRLAVVVAEQLSYRRGSGGHPTLIVGAGVIGDKIARRLRAQRQYGLMPVGFLDPAPIAQGDADGLPVLGGPDDLEMIVRETEVEHVVFAFSSMADSELIPLIRRCERMGLGVSLVPRLWESLNHRAIYETLGGMPLMELTFSGDKRWQLFVKDALDRIVAVCLLLVLSPLLAVLAAAVKLSSRGPVLLRQRRVGCDGHVFDLLKFRTMRPGDGTGNFLPPPGNAPGGVEGDDRRTAVGRLMRAVSLDELPQLVNVVRGEMSLVGPRPERPEYVHRFTTEIGSYGDRHRVRSGMTGWAQVHGLRGQTSLEDRVEWDNYYIENWSLGLDMRILALTPIAMFRPSD